MQYSHHGMTLWYGTPDAPAPEGEEHTHTRVSVTVGVRPVHPSNTVVVRYRVDGGPLQTLPAILMRTDFTNKKQYFRATFPHFREGNQVEYLPILSCAGRQAPDVATARSFPSSFRPQTVRDPQGHTDEDTDAPPSQPAPEQGRFLLNLDYLCTVKAQLNSNPEIIGTTPEGIRVNWYITGGTVVGPRLKAMIRPKGGDWMTIRPDGIGLLGIRSTFETYDGALISMTTSGVFELGEDGYQNFLDKKWPSTPAVRPVPRFLTAHPKYQWLNRLQCFGVGEVRMADLLVVYDLYVAR